MLCALARSADNTAPRRAVAMAAVLLILLLPRTERPAAGATAASCAARKIKATAFKTQGKLTCHAKAASKHEPVAPDCLAHAEDKFARTFDALELTGACSTNGNKGTIEHKVDQFVDDVVAELTGSPEGSLLTTPAARSCGARKLKATGRKAAAKLNCHARAVLKSVAVADSCLTRAEDNFSRRWGVLEAVAGCATTNDEGTIENKVNAFVDDVVASLTTTGSTTSTVTTTTTSTTTSSTTTTTSSTTSTAPPTTTTSLVTTTSLAITTTSLPVTTTSLPVTTTSLAVTTTSLLVTTTSLPITTTSLTVTTTSLPFTTTSLAVTTTSLLVPTTSLPITTTSLAATTTSLTITT